MWTDLNNLSQLDEIISESNNAPVAIFKHSTSCGISRMVKRNFEADIKAKSQVISKIYYLDLLANRDISNAIADTFNVKHESPQLIILKDGIVTSHSSHSNISAQVIS